MRRREPRVLYFTKSIAVTDEDEALADSIGTNVGFRNASLHPTDGTLEACVAVAGYPPKAYTDKYPTVKSKAQLDRLVGRLAPDPFDRDGDGKPGGSTPQNDADLSDRDKLKKEAEDLGLTFANNIPTTKLQELVDAKKGTSAGTDTAATGTGSDEPPNPNTPPAPPSAPTWGPNN